MRAVPLDRTLLAQAIAADRDASVPAHAVACALQGRAIALLDAGVLVAAGGVVPAWPGLAQAWAIVTTLGRPRQILAAVLACRSWLDELQLDPAFARVEFHVRWDVPWRSAFARGVGANVEPVRLVRWGPTGVDYALYARLARGN